jgi:hypothetical protein
MEVTMRSLVLLAVLLFISTTASAASLDPPKRKSGLWDFKMTSQYAKGATTVQQRVDEKPTI